MKQRSDTAFARWRKSWLGPALIALAVCTAVIGIFAGVSIWIDRHQPCPPTIWEMIGSEEYAFPQRKFYPKGCSYGVENVSIIPINEFRDAFFTAVYVRYHEDSGTAVFDTPRTVFHVYNALTETGKDLWPEQLHRQSIYAIRCPQAIENVTVQETYRNDDGVVIEYGQLTTCQRGFIHPLSVNDRFTRR